MKKIKSSLTLIITLVLALLLASTAAAYFIIKNSRPNPDVILQTGFNHPFMGADVFSQMQEIDKQIDSAFEQQRKLVSKIFQESKASLRSSSSLTSYQDEKFYRYELKFSSFKKEDIVISYEGGMLTLSAKSDKSLSKDKTKELRSSKSFYYSLSIPSDVVGDPEIKREEGKIEIKFARAAQKAT